MCNEIIEIIDGARNMYEITIPKYLIDNNRSDLGIHIFRAFIDKLLYHKNAMANDFSATEKAISVINGLIYGGVKLRVKKHDCYEEITIMETGAAVFSRQQPQQENPEWFKKLISIYKHSKSKSQLMAKRVGVIQ